MVRTLACLAALLAGGRALAAPPAPEMAEIKVTGGSYYVGRATGEFDYRKLANASTPGFLVMRGELTQGAFAEIVAWGTLHGYGFEDACQACDRGHDVAPVADISWRDAALVANALSERAGLDAVYRDGAGQPVREAAGFEHVVIEPTLGGYRLPTIPEWQIALRGADKALAEGSYGGPARSPNALGLIDTAGPLGEWTASAMVLDSGRTHYFACNETVDGAMHLSNCTLHAPGWAGPAVGVRLVRKLPK